MKLSNLNITIIGAGPGGLTFALAARQSGARVMVLEQAGDPRSHDPGYTDRSFNLTLNQVGRAVLDPKAWQGSIDLVGRAVHKDQQPVMYASYGEGESAVLTSIPRPVLRQNMVGLAEQAGVKMRFGSQVAGLDPETSRISLDNAAAIESDLVVVADGVHSLADDIIKHRLGNPFSLRIEPLRYITVMLSQSACRNLSLHHIHFWQEAGSQSVAIGLPNRDGTVATLLIAKFETASGASPFPNKALAQASLERDFPQLLALEPTLLDQVVGRQPGNFYYKSIDDYILGKKTVVVGDAGSASPPWAGFGANTAIYSADALIKFLANSQDMEEALEGYQAHKRILAELVLGYAEEHGEFLNKKVTKNPEQRPIGPVLGQLVSQAVEASRVPASIGLLTFAKE